MIHQLQISMESDAWWSDWAMDDGSRVDPIGSGGTSACGSNEVPLHISGASEKEFSAMQDAYDTMSVTVKNTKQMARTLALEPDPANIKGPLISAGLEHAKKVQEGLDELDVLMTTPKDKTNDSMIKKVLLTAAEVFSPLLSISADMKKMVGDNDNPARKQKG